MSHATCATMHVRSVRPCFGRHPLVRHSQFSIQVEPRLSNKRFRAEGSEPLVKPSSQRNDDAKCLSRSRKILMSPEHRFRRISDYIDNMQRDVETVLHGFGARPGFSRRSPFGLVMDLTTPLREPLRSLAYDIEEDDKEYKIQAAIPGFGKENVKITLSEDGVLSVEGHVMEDIKEPTSDKKEEPNTDIQADAEKPRADASWTSKRSRDFVRRLHLPDNADQEGIRAAVENGVLTVIIPKIQKPEPAAKEIPIN